MRIWPLLISIFSLSTQVFCQQQEEIEGKIVDINNKPLPYATIRLKNFSIGVVSNQSGDFRLPLRPHLFQDTLIISYIGYATYKLPIAQLKSVGDNIIVLKESPTQMAEIEIRSKRLRALTGKKIVAAAISNININYPVDPFTYVAYYRDYQIKENNYTNLSEAIVRVVDNGFDTNDQIETKVELMQHRINKEFPIDSLTTIPYDNREKKFIPQAQLGSFGGNELAILMVHDALRNYKQYSYSFVNIFSKNFIRNHVFKLSKVIDHNDIQLYEVKFTSTKVAGENSHFSQGDIYIEKGNYKVHKMEYSMYDKRLGDKLIYNIKVEYRENNNKMYLNYVSFNNEFKMRNPDDFRVLDTRILSNLYGFSVLFSHPPESTTATNKNNYVFTIRGKKVELDTVLFSSDREHREVIAVIKNPKEYAILQLADAEMAKQTTATVSNIIDSRNRLVDQATFVQATQYRELFVQRVQPESASDVNVIAMDKFIPLNKARVTLNMRDFADYWMNTPLKSEIE